MNIVATRSSLIVGVAAMVAGSAGPAHSSDCSLADHIKSANTNTAVSACPAGTNHDINAIIQDITLAEPLPPFADTITIEGGGHTISGAGRLRIFDVQEGGRLTIGLLILVESTSASAVETDSRAATRTLYDHILAANTNLAVGGCSAGSNHDITLRLPLPEITGTITT